MQMAANEAATIFEFISNNFHIVGWTALGVAAWRLRGYIDKFLAGVALSDTRLQETQAIAIQVRSGVDQIQTNHLAHMEKDMTALADVQASTIQVLTSIDKGIGILVDRGREA